MSFDHIIDIDSLTQPVSEQTPSGSDIRSDRSPTSDYYSIKDARNNARAAERSSMFDDNVDLIAPWRTVVDLAPKILKEKSKDLEVASWYTEGLIRLHGLAGLRDGFKLILSLVQTHWDGLYPEPDEDGLETKVAPITGLNGDGSDGTLLMPIRNAALTDEGDYGSFNLWQYQKARDNDKITDEDERQSRIGALGYSLQDIEQTIAQSPVEFYIDMIATLQELTDDYKTLCALLRDHCGNDAPPSSNITALLEEVTRSVRFLSKEKIEQFEANNVQVGDLADDQSEDTSTANQLLDQALAAPISSTGAIANREDALKRLQDIADYFRLHEPHTPVAPGIERLITWGRMTVSELMMELLPEDHSRGLFTQLTGVKLDGSDTEKYVAPPTISSAPAATPKPVATPNEAAPAPEPAQPSGW